MGHDDADADHVESGEAKAEGAVVEARVGYEATVYEGAEGALAIAPGVVSDHAFLAVARDLGPLRVDEVKRGGEVLLAELADLGVGLGHPRSQAPGTRLGW